MISGGPPPTLALRAGGIWIALLACGMAAACGDEPPPPAREDRAVVLEPDSVHRVQIERLAGGPAITGLLAPAREGVIRARVTGRILETYVEEGDRIARGAPVARLDDAALRDAYLSARSAVRAAGRALEDARRDADRAGDLQAAGAIPRQEVERAQSEVARAEAQLADARARLVLTEEELAETTLRAPFAGRISARDVAAGELVQAGTPLFTVVDLSRLRLEAAVPVRYLARLDTGARVDFTVAGFPDQSFTGTIDRISPAADPATGQIIVFATIPNDDGRLAGGLFAEGRLALEVSENPAVPLAAIDDLGPRPAVLRLGADGRAERVEVRLGVRDNRAARVEILEGLEAGDLVVIGAARTMTPGTPVTFDEPDAATAVR